MSASLLSAYAVRNSCGQPVEVAEDPTKTFWEHAGTEKDNTSGIERVEYIKAGSIFSAKIHPDRTMTFYIASNSSEVRDLREKRGLRVGLRGGQMFNAFMAKKAGMIDCVQGNFIDDNEASFLNQPTLLAAPTAALKTLVSMISASQKQTDSNDVMRDVEKVYQSYTDNLAQAASNTFTGKMSARNGFTNLVWTELSFGAGERNAFMSIRPRWCRGECGAKAWRCQLEHQTMVPDNSTSTIVFKCEQSCAEDPTQHL